MAVNLKQIAEYVAANENISKASAERILNDAFAFIRNSVTADEVVIPKFGKFKTVARAERQGRNPATGAAITIPASTKVTFKAASAFKEEVK